MFIKMITGTYGYVDSDGKMLPKNKNTEAFEVSDTEGKRLIDMGYAKQEDKTIEIPEKTEDFNESTVNEEQLSDMKKPDLEKLAKDMGLPSYGNKDELITRILSATRETESPPHLEAAEPEE